MNAIDLLETQHKETLEMFTQLKNSKPGAARKQTFKKMQGALLAHMLIEEEIFYPSVAMQSSDGEPIAEGYEEHAGAPAAIDRCARAVSEEELFAVRIGVLEEMVKHHIKEERDEIFPRARKGLGQEELERLGEEMEARFYRAQKAPSPAAKLNRMSTVRARQALEH
jgi:iron-sulfur cluster repair protein YtfE (RIC family)